jgi:hypothetical protein
MCRGGAHVSAAGAHDLSQQVLRTRATPEDPSDQPHPLEVHTVNPIARALRGLASQEVARANAAGAAAELRQRLEHHLEVEDYLARRIPTRDLPRE